MDLAASRRVERGVCGACAVILSLWDDPTRGPGFLAAVPGSARARCEATLAPSGGTTLLPTYQASLNLRPPWSGLMPPRHDLSLHMRSGLFSRKSRHWWKTNKEIRQTLDKPELSHERQKQKCKWFDQEAAFTLCETPHSVLIVTCLCCSKSTFWR